MWSKLASACCLVLSACASPHETEPQAVSLGGDVVRAMLEADVGRLVGLSRDCFSEQAVIPLHVVGSECERPAELFGKPVVDYDESRMRFDAGREWRRRRTSGCTCQDGGHRGRRLDGRLAPFSGDPRTLGIRRDGT